MSTISRYVPQDLSHLLLPVTEEEIPYLLTDEALSIEEVDEGREWLDRLSLPEQMTKNAIIASWEMGASPQHAVHMLIENGLFSFSQVMFFIAQQAKTAAIIEGAE